MSKGVDQLDHLTFEQLVDYQEGRLSQIEADLVEAHLATDCDQCQDELTWLSEIQALMHSSIWILPPEELRASARRAYRERYRPAKPKLSLVDWLEAILAPRRPLVLAGTAALLLLIIVGVVLFAFNGQQPGLTATVAQVSGLVEYREAGSDKWQTAQDGTVLNASDHLRTGDTASAAIQFPDESVTSVKSLTELSILQLRRPRGNEGQIVVLRQSVGHTHHEVAPQATAASRFEVETPSAVIAVRGTMFNVEVNEAGATLVSVEEGFVEVSSEGTDTVVQAGGMASVLPGSTPAPGVPLPSSTPSPTGVIVSTTDTRSAPLEPDEETTPTSTPTPVPTSTPSPTSGVFATPTTPPTATQPPPPPPPPPSPTSPPDANPTATPEPEETKKTPPGLTRTPQPPGQTKTPGASKP